MVNPLSYDSVLTLEEAQARYNEVYAEFGKVKEHYESKVSNFLSRGKIREEDLKTLSDCTGVLLPLGAQKSVQEQVVGVQKIEDSLWYKCGKLGEEILVYASKFKNGGVKIVPNPFPVLD